MEKVKLKLETFKPLDQVSVSQQEMQPSPITPQISKTESAIRGGAQGLMFGFPDEATALLESITKGVPYEKSLEESRLAYKQAQEANPITYTGSEIAGGVLPALIPGVGQAATGAKLGRLATIGAGTGALSGLGYSEGQDVGQVAKDVGIGGALGGALPVLGRGIAKGVQSLKPAADEAIKTSLTGFTGKTRAFLDQIEKNPEQVKRIESKFAGDIQQEILPEINAKINDFMAKIFNNIYIQEDANFNTPNEYDIKHLIRIISNFKITDEFIDDFFMKNGDIHESFLKYHS